MKVLTSLLLLFMTTAFAQQVVPHNEQDEAKCKNLLKEELIKRGMVNKNVCLDDSNYPNVSISMDNYKHILGDENKLLKTDDVAALQVLDKLLSNSMKDLNGAKKEIQGYSDGKAYSGTKYDSQLGFESCGAGKKKVTQKTLDYINSIKDPNIKAYVDGKAKIGDCIAASGEKMSVYIDILRNHVLAFNRAKDFCEQVNIGIDDCTENSLGMPSPDLIQNAHNKDIKDLNEGDYQGVCDERRGIKYNFYFPDEVKKERIVNNGFFEPEYDITGRELQNKMQFAAAMDFMKTLNKNADDLPELSASSEAELYKSKSFADIDADKERFKKILAGTGCENNDYQIDNQRRKFWSIQKEIKKSEEMFKNAKPEQKAFLDAVKSGDYQKFKQYEDIMAMASLNGIPVNQDYLREVQRAQNYNEQLFDQQVNAKLVQIKNKMDMFPKNREYLQKQYDEQKAQYEKMKNSAKNMHEKTKNVPKNFLNDPVNAQMVIMARTLLTGVPVNQGNQDFKKYNALTEGYIGKQFVDENNVKLKLKKQPHLHKYVKNGHLHRYPDSSFGTGSNAYPATDIHACSSVADAMADYISQTANPNLLKSDLKIGDDVQLGVDNLDKVELNERVSNGLAMGSTEDYFSKFSGNGSHSGKGWICKGCGSGVHVHEDGSVHYVSRNRTEDLGGAAQSGEANKTPMDINSDKLTLGAFQNIKSYQIENCGGCNCLKNLDGSKLSDILTGKNSNHPTKQHNMVKMVDGKPMINKDQNKYTINKSNTCVFSPPVPHSCNYDPEGDSKVDMKAQEVKENLYCTLYNEIKGNEGRYPAVLAEMQNQLKLDEAKRDYEKTCGQKVFPMSEQDCLKKAKDASGNTPKASKVIGQ